MVVTAAGRYFDELDTALTELIRYARGPRLSAEMTTGVAGDVDRNLMPLLSLIVDRGPVRASELLRLIAVDQSTLSRQVRSLVDHGLVERAEDPDDRRAMLLSASAQGRDAVLATREHWRATLAGLMAGWTADERQTFLTSLTRLSVELREHVEALRMDERVATNRQRWDEMSDLHIDTSSIDDVDAAGSPTSNLTSSATSGLRVCHLQCHIGGDSFAVDWAPRR